MGQFRAVITGVGGHGCQRDRGDGDHVVGCERPNCPDCIVRECVRRLKRAGVLFEGASVIGAADGGETTEIRNGAVLEHWPGTKGQVTDDLISGKRSGSF